MTELNFEQQKSNVRRYLEVLVNLLIESKFNVENIDINEILRLHFREREGIDANDFIDFILQNSGSAVKGIPYAINTPVRRAVRIRLMGLTESREEVPYKALQVAFDIKNEKTISAIFIKFLPLLRRTLINLSSEETEESVEEFIEEIEESGEELEIDPKEEFKSTFTRMWDIIYSPIGTSRWSEKYKKIIFTDTELNLIYDLFLAEYSSDVELSKRNNPEEILEWILSKVVIQLGGNDLPLTEYLNREEGSLLNELAIFLRYFYAELSDEKLSYKSIGEEFSNEDSGNVNGAKVAAIVQRIAVGIHKVMNAFTKMHEQ